ncbi:hypothetical protein [Peristeroidobacter soli]|jgi:hypothetical protein|uniref:hypothetical protein n=1 Tax=Peristeroidobacter soli TaxID=2497877 RepID=UPI00101CCF4E|nr:hypothetical protein [Peristeroidobacter soli]
MESVRQQLLRLFPIQIRVDEPGADVAAAIYAMLWGLEDLAVDGWALFRVVRESAASLEAVGLMTLLPDGSVPMSVSVKGDEMGLAWSARAGVQDQQWLALLVSGVTLRSRTVPVSSHRGVPASTA